LWAKIRVSQVRDGFGRENRTVGKYEQIVVRTTIAALKGGHCDVNRKDGLAFCAPRGKNDTSVITPLARWGDTPEQR